MERQTGSSNARAGHRKDIALCLNQQRESVVSLGASRSHSATCTRRTSVNSRVEHVETQAKKQHHVQNDGWRRRCITTNQKRGAHTSALVASCCGFISHKRIAAARLQRSAIRCESVNVTITARGVSGARRRRRRCKYEGKAIMQLMPPVIRGRVRAARRARGHA